MKTILDLGQIPLVNNLKNTKEESINAKRYPLKAMIDDSLTVRLDTQVEPSEMFGEYLYRSSVSEPYKNHCNKMWYDIQHFVYGACPYPKKDLVVLDIGGNDGTLLKCFKRQHNKEVLGNIELFNVDPSSSFREDNTSEGIHYIQDFWGDNIELPKKANLIISTNVFQHNSDVRKFLAGIQKNLDGIWVLEFPYFLRTAQTNQFDQFYHEHYFYWLITPLVELFKEYGLGIISISEHDIHGGTIRIVSSNLRESDQSVLKKYLMEEQKFDFAGWADKIRKKVMSDQIFMANLFMNGSVACFGAAAKGCVYLNSLGRDITDKMMYVVDDTIGKQGKYVPGTKLRVVSRQTLYETQPEYLLILAHNFKTHIINSLRPHYKGRIVVMLPEIEIYD
jgi:hypothetical protein